MDKHFTNGFYKGIGRGLVMLLAFFVVLLVRFFDFPPIPTLLVGFVVSGLWGVYVENSIKDNFS